MQSMRALICYAPSRSVLLSTNNVSFGSGAVVRLFSSSSQQQHHKRETPGSSNASHDLVVYENLGSGIASLTLNNPKKRNALSIRMMESMLEKLLAIEARTRTDDTSREESERVVIIKAAGPVFCAGHDLKEFYNPPEQVDIQQHHKHIFGLCTSMMETIRNLPAVVIAQVGTLATAAGCQLVASTDLVVASHSAGFATPGVKIGLFCTTPGVALARAVPHRKALEMLLTGETISAQEALQYGLVNKVVSDDLLDHSTLQVAHKIAEASGDVLRIGKKAFYEQISKKGHRRDVYDFAEGVMCSNLTRPDAKEGISSFLAKKHPQWRS